MSSDRVKVNHDAIYAYGDRRGTVIYHRDPKTGAVVDGTRDSKRSANSSVRSTTTPGHKVRAIDIYDRTLEPEEWEAVPGHEGDLNVPRVQAQPYTSKFHTTYEPKTHYRFHDSYGALVEEDPLVKQFLEDEEAPAIPEPKPPVPPPKVVTTPPPKSEPKSVSTSPPPSAPLKEKKKARPRRPLSPSRIEVVSDEDEKREFVGWVMNGKKEDMGISERLLFKRRGH